jgi:hypothetical protein
VDRKLLAGMIEQFLFDPRGTRRVRVKTAERMPRGETREVEREGWLTIDKDGKPARVFFTDGESIPAPDGKAITALDFVAECRERYRERPAGRDGTGIGDAVCRAILRNQEGQEHSDLVLAAWLSRLGHDGLAAQALAAARRGNEEIAAVRARLAQSGSKKMIWAHAAHADEEALAHGERLLRLYPEEVKKGNLPARAVVEDLRRREKKGSFGPPKPESWPIDFPTWDLQKRAAFLIEALDEAEVRLWFGSDRSAYFTADQRVAALIRMGDAAVPALIEAVEKDERLTRSVSREPENRGDTDWRLVEAREAALAAVQEVLRVRVLEPGAGAVQLRARNAEEGRQAAARLRAYWKANGHLPFDARMMKVLTDPRSSGEATREAAANLAQLGQVATAAPPFFRGLVAARPRVRNPALARFRKPTAAEAVLAAMDLDLAATAAAPRPEDYERRCFAIEEVYLSALIELGDQRLAPALVKRGRAADSVRLRRQWAYAAHWLGEPEPLRAFTRAFQAGTIQLPANDRAGVEDRDQPGTFELGEIVGCLAGAGTPEGDRALFALTDPRHPYHKLAAQVLLSGQVGGNNDRSWFAHPYCLDILRQGLDDTRPTGQTYRIIEDFLACEGPRWISSQPLPTFLADPAARRNEAAQRAYDVTAENLNRLVPGQPTYHPLLKDADDRLRSLRASLDRFRRRYRRMTPAETTLLDFSRCEIAFLPDVRPLGRAATADDVKQGKALFHLDGKGKPAGLRLPASAVLRRDADKKDPPRVLIVQAEVGADGALTYGIIGKDVIRAVTSKELADVQPLGGK